MNKWIFFIGLCLITTTSTFAQVKTLIPEEDEVNLPLDDTRRIGITTSFDESKLSKDTLSKALLESLRRNLDGRQYYIIDSGSNFIELFIVYPCKTFNLENIHAHEILNEGIITSTLYIKLKHQQYDVQLTGFEWINKRKDAIDLNSLYKKYVSNTDLKEKIKYYGVLKSAEFSIAETFSNMTLVIEDIIKMKSSM